MRQRWSFQSRGVGQSWRGAGLVLGLAVVLMPLRLSAHQTQISDRVGGTHHIEPNDTPRAGEPSLTWFGLTQVGGNPIGLSDCDCALAVYDVARDGEVAIATPPLSATDVEGLEDVPSAELVFPQVGAYVLSLTGSPKGAADFSNFRLDFPVTVAAGQAQTEPAGSDTSNGSTGEPEAAAQTEVAQGAEADLTTNISPLLIAGAVIAVAVVAMLWRTRRQR